MFKKIAIKIGSNVLANSDGALHKERIAQIVDQIVELKNKGIEVIIISSGAVAAGKQILKKTKTYDTVTNRQIWASLGQVQLINIYNELLKKHNLICSQVLVTKNDFHDRNHYLNMKNCISSLLEHNIIPIINENDVVSITELMFTDNDELAGLIASMIDAEALIILSNINGIYNGSPDNPDSKLISVIHENFDNVTDFISTKKSNFGRGGMLTKYKMAKKTASSGITVYITNGLKDNILLDLLKDDSSVLNTKFLPGRKKSNVKKWIAHSEGFEKGIVKINDGAKNALLSNKASSLLFIGVISINGDFKKGDILKIIDENGNCIGLGRSKYDAKDAIFNIGKDKVKPLVHYDYLYLNGES